MAKVFTISPGLENMGALKTGGQGSVYRGRRIGEITTAIKLLPTPIYSESQEDKNFRDFQNEVEKLKRVNEDPNPNVVKILSSGLSETGNFPFIEMEFIEGPELEELIRPPHDRVFTLKEVIKVAEQLSNALAHCHKKGVKHGDIKSNNVKFSTQTCNYVLLDFGLAIMSDEDRRTSLRKAGAVEFMAPEQNDGLMLFETDVYGFGVILFELLAGQVPFPLEDKGETARNTVRLSHIETPPPDLLELREKNMPLTWPEEKREQEMHVPEWLVDMVYKCLQKKPQARFANGIELHEYIVYNRTHFTPPALLKDEVQQLALARQESEKLLSENESLQKQLREYSNQIAEKNKELQSLKSIVEKQKVQLLSDIEKSDKYSRLVESSGGDSNTVSKRSFYTWLAASVVLAVLCTWLLSRSPNKVTTAGTLASTANAIQDTNKGIINDTAVDNIRNITYDTEKKEKARLELIRAADSLKAKQKALARASGEKKQDTVANNPGDDSYLEPDAETGTLTAGARYKANNVAHFYNSPDEGSQRSAFINKWNPPATALEEKDDFIYVEYTNEEGQVTKGWLRKKDLKQLKD